MSDELLIALCLGIPISIWIGLWACYLGSPDKLHQRATYWRARWAMRGRIGIHMHGLVFRGKECSEILLNYSERKEALADLKTPQC